MRFLADSRFEIFEALRAHSLEFRHAHAVKRLMIDGLKDQSVMSKTTDVK